MADKRLKTLNPAASVSALADRLAELAADTSLILVGPVFAPAGGEWGGFLCIRRSRTRRVGRLR